MPAKKGNNYAIGNKGGARPDKQTRKKIQTFKGLVLNKAIATMRSRDENKKWELILKVIGSLMPKAIELPEDSDGEIRVTWGKK